jgi:hypothetical protein
MGDLRRAVETVLRGARLRAVEVAGFLSRGITIPRGLDECLQEQGDAELSLLITCDARRLIERSMSFFHVGRS